jgi:manganese transport protein
VLSMQLPFAIFPLVMMTSNRAMMGEFVNGRVVQVIGYSICAAISGLNVYLLWSVIGPFWLGVVAAVMIGFAAWVRFGYRAASAS